MGEKVKDELLAIAYNCRKATFIIEKKQLTEISLREKLELKIHLAGCSVCRLFEQQSIMINKLAKSLRSAAEGQNRVLDADFKLMLEEKIRTKLAE